MTVANILEALVNGHDETQPDKTDGIPYMPMNCGAFTTRFNKITLVDLGIDDPTSAINMGVNAYDDGFDDWDDDDSEDYHNDCDCDFLSCWES